ncbi:carboxypeptidase O-like [Vanessa tameamea]|uniref:Carboxypeptidase O-like n=1 Tax=Vanessa tameamea TaxID=334116 RepID=A0ABM4AZW0_VANTA
MSSALILNLFSELINSTSSLNSLLSKFDFYLLPILNPDGFVFSKKQDRLWSKNRRDIYPQKKCHHGKFPIGVNIARNWFFEKSSKMIDEECNSIYVGHKTLSEEESQALSYVLNSLALDMIAFINVKGFGRYITVPYGHTTSLANNHDIMMEILRSTCSKVLENHNITYYVGTTSYYFYNFSGNMADWVKFKLNTPVVYTVYLEDENTVLPLPSQINPLKAQLFTILNESMFISQDIYGPLFNNEVNTFSFYIKHVYNIYMFNSVLNIYCMKTLSL